MRTAILSLLSAFVVLCFAVGRTATSQYPQAGNAGADTLPDSVPASVQRIDTFETAGAADSVRRDTGSVRLRVQADTASAVTDTLAADSAKKRSSGLDAPVEYEAADSLVYEGESGLAFLYGSARVNYQDMQLDAAKISMDMDSNMVRAEGRRDTAGKVSGEPVYKQGTDTYNSEQMSFNFKSKRGYISNVKTKQGDGYLQSERSKRTKDGTLYLEHANYTTCDAEHPHFYLRLSRGKVRPGKEAFFGPAYLVVEDVPLPLAVPYGFFPFSKKNTRAALSCLLMAMKQTGASTCVTAGTTSR